MSAEPKGTKRPYDDLTSSSEDEPLVNVVKRRKIEKTVSPSEYKYTVDNPDTYFWVVDCPENQGSSKIAAFDMDHTLIMPKGGKKFASGRKDWLYWPDGSLTVKNKLCQLHDEGYKIVVLTNQAGIKKNNTSPEEITGKIQDLAHSLGVPLVGLVAGSKDGYRKPFTGGWEYFLETCNRGVAVDKQQSFFVGDAAGREKNWKPGKKKDFNASDRKFAKNIGVKFHTPEAFFLGERESTRFTFGKQPHPSRFLKQRVGDSSQLPKASQGKEMVVMVGCPGSGKSTVAKTILSSYEWVNQDTLKTESKCKKAAKAALQQGRNVVIDNTNRNKRKRHIWLSMAKEFGYSVRCFWMTTGDPVYDKELASHMNKFRNRTTGQKMIPMVALHSYAKQLEEPKVSEGFASVHRIPFVPKFSSENQRKLFCMWAPG